MVKKKKRAPGGGRKPLDLDETQSVKVMARVSPALRKALQSLAEKHHCNLSTAIKRALRHWVERHEIPQLHILPWPPQIGVLADRS